MTSRQVECGKTENGPSHQSTAPHARRSTRNIKLCAQSSPHGTSWQQQWDREPKKTKQVETRFKTRQLQHEKKGNRDPFASRSLAAFARYVGHPKVIIQGDSEHALMAVIHDACALLTAATPRTSPVNSKGSNGAAERAVQSVEGMARTLRLDLLSRTSIAVGSDLPITSWMVRHAAWLLSHFQTGSADGKTAYARQFERPYELPVLPFAERVMWKDPTLQPAKLKSSWGYGLWLGRSQTSNAHLIGTRVGIVVARTIRRLPASEREDSNLVVAMRGTPVAGRPADAAAGDAFTVTRHAVEQREVIVGSCKLWRPTASGQRRRRQRTFQSSSKPS